MKKKLLSLIVAVAMLFSVVTFVVQADTEREIISILILNTLLKTLQKRYI